MLGDSDACRAFILGSNAIVLQLCSAVRRQVGARDCHHLCWSGSATALATRDPKAWADPHLPALIVDLALLVALMWVVSWSSRWFPTWFAGFHLVAVVSHLASVLAPGFAPKLYFLLQSLWSVPMLLTLVIGVMLDRQAGISDEPEPQHAPRRWR